MDRVADQFISTLKALEFHEKVEPGNLASQLPNERHRRGRRAPCGQQVIHDQHAFSHTNRIAVDGKGVQTVFEAVFDFKNVGGQFAGLPDWNEPGVQPIRQEPTENEPARFNTDDFGYPLSQIVGGQLIGDRRQGAGVFEQRGDIVEENTWLGEIGYLPNEGAIIDGGHRSEQVGLCHGSAFNGMAQTRQGGHFNLPDPLTGQPHLPADFFQRLGLTPIEPEP